MLERGVATVGYRLSYLANFYTEPVYKEIDRRYGLARSEFVVLLCLSQLGQLSAQNICETTGRPKNSISQAVAKLASAKHINRTPDEADARRVYLSLSPSGSALCDEIIPLFRAREAQMLSVLDASEQQQFEALLERLTQRQDGWADLY